MAIRSGPTRHWLRAWRCVAERNSNRPWQFYKLVALWTCSLAMCSEGRKTHARHANANGLVWGESQVILGHAMSLRSYICLTAILAVAHKHSFRNGQPRCCILSVWPYIDLNWALHILACFEVLATQWVLMCEWVYFPLPLLRRAGWGETHAVWE